MSRKARMAEPKPRHNQSYGGQWCGNDYLDPVGGAIVPDTIESIAPPRASTAVRYVVPSTTEANGRWGWGFHNHYGTPPRDPDGSPTRKQPGGLVQAPPGR